jgi:hypothetical protein
MAKGSHAEGQVAGEEGVEGKGGQAPRGGLRGVSGLTGFGLGFALATVMGAAGGPLARAFRPVLRTAVKGGIRTGRWLSQVAEQTREHLEDVVAEARHEMGEEDTGHGHEHHPHHHGHDHVHLHPAPKPPDKPES